MSSLTFERIKGPSLVGMAAFLWATDALIRFPSLTKITPTAIVLIEHVLAVFILLPWLFLKHRNAIFSLNAKEWFSAAFSGIGGSAIATLFFTASFLYINPSVAVLLQKLQPVLVVLIAFFILGEKPEKKFYFWGFIALGAGIVLSFPDFDFSFLRGKMDLRSKGIQYSLGAAFLWAASTISGKVLLKRTPASLAAFWRFFFGLIGLLVMMVLANDYPQWQSLLEKDNVITLLYLSLIPGLFAMLIYYQGLSKTPASVTTFIELLYPIGAVALNTAILHTPLGNVQTVAGAILLIAVAAISF